MDIGSPQKILLIRADVIGDMLVTTPSIRAIRKKYPHAQIDMLCTAHQGVVLTNNPHLNTIYQFDKKNYLSILQIILQLRKETYDLAINFHGSSRTSSILTLFIKSKIRLCYGRPRAGKNRVQWFPPRIADHMIYNYQTMLDELGIQNDSYKMEYFLPHSMDEKAYPKKANNIYRFAIFIGNATKPRECWQTEKFVELTKYLLTHQNIEVYIIGGPTELAHVHLFDSLKTSPQLHFFINQPFANVAALLTTCDALISGSSGLGHLASALGTPVLSLLYIKSMIFWRTLGEKDMHILPENPQIDPYSLDVNVAAKWPCPLRVPNIDLEKAIKMANSFMEREGMLITPQQNQD